MDLQLHKWNKGLVYLEEKDGVEEDGWYDSDDDCGYCGGSGLGVDLNPCRCLVYVFDPLETEFEIVSIKRGK